MTFQDTVDAASAAVWAKFRAWSRLPAAERKRLLAEWRQERLAKYDERQERRAKAVDEWGGP